MKTFNNIRRYLGFFIFMCFVTASCTMLFVRTMGIPLSGDGLNQAARFTFYNVVALSLLYTIIDVIRRRFTVERPIRRITEAAGRVMRGDLSVRIEKSPLFDSSSGFDTIIDYFNRMVQELGGMETLRTDFIANVSHELKTPLAVIQNYGTMLQQRGLPEAERLEYAKTITGAARDLASMVSNILRLNQLENQSIYPACAAFDLGEQLCECLLGFENLWEEKQLELNTSIEDGVLIEADPELLSLVWNNLFSNAVKFTPPGGCIGLSLETEGGTAVVRVSDTGCGIPREAVGHIFEKFYQADSSHATQGNGLGLALVRRVMDIADGEISVESEPGRGSVFTVKLRRCADGQD